MLTMGSLFAGIGGFELGFTQAGITCRWSVELDKACRQVLARRFPDTAVFVDVREVGAHNLCPVDIITFGSPCQDLSLAGKRAGLEGTRSGLIFEALRICRELRPALAVWENVPGALSSHGGWDFAAILTAFQDSRALDIAWRVFDARYFGVAQRRRRVFLVADFRDRRAGQILFESEGLHGYPATCRKTGAVVAALTASGVGTCGADDTQAQAGHLIPAPSLAGTVSAKWAKGTGGPSGDECQNLIAAAITTNPYADRPGEEGNLIVTHALTASHDASEDGSGRGVPLVFEARYVRNGRGAPDEIVPCLTSQAGTTGKGDAAPLVLAFSSKDDGGDAGDIAPTLRAMPAEHSHANGGGQMAVAIDVRNLRGVGEISGTLQSKSTDGYSLNYQNPVQQDMIVRRLTPVECERLQGFPDGWTAGQSDATRYRQLGNAVCVNVVYWIARRIVEVLR